MGSIGVTEVQAGMVICADVTATGDRLLLKAGTELTEDHLRMLSMWGVVEVEVEGVCPEDLTAKAAAQLAPGELGAVESRVHALFRHNDRSHPIIAELVRLTTRRLMRRAGGHTDGL